MNPAAQPQFGSLRTDVDGQVFESSSIHKQQRSLGSSRQEFPHRIGFAFEGDRSRLDIEQPGSQGTPSGLGHRSFNPQGQAGSTGLDHPQLQVSRRAEPDNAVHSLRAQPPHHVLSVNEIDPGTRDSSLNLETIRDDGFKRILGDRAHDVQESRARSHDKGELLKIASRSQSHIPILRDDPGRADQIALMIQLDSGSDRLGGEVERVDDDRSPIRL